MPYRSGRALFPDPGKRCLAKQTVNAYRPIGDLDPVSEAPAEAVREGWAPLLPGQAIPLLGERVTPDAQPGDCL